MCSSPRIPLDMHDKPIPIMKASYYPKPIVIQKCYSTADFPNCSPHPQSVLSDEMLLHAKRRAHVLLELRKMETGQLYPPANELCPNQQVSETDSGCKEKYSPTARKTESTKKLKQDGRSGSMKQEFVISEILTQHSKAQWNINNILKDLTEGLLVIFIAASLWHIKYHILSFP